MDKRPLLAQSAPRSVTMSPRTGLGCERCRVRVNEQFGRSRLAHPRSNKIFFDPSSQQLFCPRAQEHPMRVRSDSGKHRTAPSSCGAKQKGIVIQPPTFQCRRKDLVYKSVIYVIKTRPEGEIEGWK